MTEARQNRLPLYRHKLKRRRRKTGSVAELLEDRILLTSDLTYQATDDRPLTVRVLQSELQIVPTNSPETVLASAGFGLATMAAIAYRWRGALFKDV